jgi:hypothetical protein
MTPERRLQIEQLANLYGSANCWTGATGSLAAAIRELLAEIDKIRRTMRNNANVQSNPEAERHRD